MISKILVANRGEIAVRIVRACAELGVKSVAIYSDADRSALHVKKADEAYNIGPDPVGGYLNAHRIVNLAVTAGCDALHPGYGFLAENPQLAEICARRGIIFIGPSASVMRRMGDKIAARTAMMEVDIPVIPGSDASLKDINAAVALGQRIGYPVMFKATNGGGGRGIRRCNNEEELRRNFARVVSEATQAFGSAAVFMEKFVLDEGLSKIPAASKVSRRLKAGKEGHVASAMPGTVVTVTVGVGDKVKAGDAVLMIEAMKMENEVPATISGAVTAVNVVKGDSVNPDEVLIEIAPGLSRRNNFCYL